MIGIKSEPPEDRAKPMGMTVQILLALVIAQGAYESYGYETTITSITEGRHGKDSLHYSGNAIDLRTRNLKQEHKQKIVGLIQEKLGPDYQVFLEKDHIHIEFQPLRNR